MNALTCKQIFLLQVTYINVFVGVRQINGIYINFYEKIFFMSRYESFMLQVTWNELCSQVKVPLYY